MTIYYKATQMDGTDFWSGRVDYAAALASGEPITLPPSTDYECCTGSVLHASTAAAETLGTGSWPCRLFEVTGSPVAERNHQRGFVALTVLREVDAHLALGPQGREVAALVDRAGSLTAAEVDALVAARHVAGGAALGAALGAAWDVAWGVARGAAWYAARTAARDVAWDAARYAARGAAGDAAWYAARTAAGDAAVAILVRDLIPREDYDTLTRLWRDTIGPIHPED